MTVGMIEAGAADLGAVMAILDSGRAAQRSLGFVQWLDGYPDEATVSRDIAARVGRLLVADGAIAGYAAVIANDPGYHSTEDAWALHGQFAVIHRLALCSRFRGKGLSSRFMTLLEDEARQRGIEVMRVDTGESNLPMHRLLARLSYTPRGAIAFPWGTRLAFEKSLLNVNFVI